MLKDCNLDATLRIGLKNKLVSMGRMHSSYPATLDELRQFWPKLSEEEIRDHLKNHHSTAFVRQLKGKVI